MRIIGVALCGVVLAGLSGCVTIQQQRSEAISAYQVGDFERAETLFEGVVKRSPIDAESWYYRGAIAHAQKKYEMAMFWYEQSLRADPGYRPAQVGMEIVRNDLGEERYNRLRTNPEIWNDRR